MNVVDSSGWLEVFSDGENAEVFEQILLKIEELIVPTICIYEVFKRLSILKDETTAFQQLSLMYEGNIVDLTRSIAISAAKISKDSKLAMADSIILATAQANDAILWTQDVNFSEIDGVNYLAKE